MAKKKSLFETPSKTPADRQIEYDRLKRTSYDSYRQRWDAYRSLAPDTSMPWYEQVLDLERRGKATTPAAHALAIAAQMRNRSHSKMEEY